MTRRSEEELYKKAEELSKRPMTNEERQEQRISFAFGNANIENPNVTRESVEEVAKERLDRHILDE